MIIMLVQCLALLALAPPSSALRLQALALANSRPQGCCRRQLPRMSGFVAPRSELTPQTPRGPQTVSVTLTGCTDGVGVGLNEDNVVDMLTPGKPAAAVLQLGDKVVSWNGQLMFDEAAGERRMLKDVVVAAESHELVIERKRALMTEVTAAPPARETPAAAATPSSKWSSEEGGDAYWGKSNPITDDDELEKNLIAGTVLFVVVFLLTQTAVPSWFMGTY